MNTGPDNPRAAKEHGNRLETGADSSRFTFHSSRITFHVSRFDWSSLVGTGATASAAFLILAILAVILSNVVIEGLPHVSWRLLSTGTATDMFDPQKAGILPMVFGTAARVMIMTILVLPAGVLTAIYLTEYARINSPLTRIIRGAVNNLAGVPSIVFGLFGLGFFVHFAGHAMDSTLYAGKSANIWGQPGLLWASATLAVMTLPVVIVATEESLRAIPQGLREASLALGATKLETIVRMVLPQAIPGIMTGAILATSRAAGEVAPILFTGVAYYMADLPRSLHDQFMDLGYHVFILSTQSPNVDKTKPLLYATVLVLLVLTFTLNIVAIIVRANMRRKLRMLQ
ncbi:MAG: phosphate ABC transporter permease PtsA [Verrucomicrobia bacterium]|nr:MAG: phosphate ABC transporter permease PtsA [Verrucomicrobiota bacterium]